MIHCLFEQSGTFKSAIEKLGGVARDYDIQNEYGNTDKIVDLFDQIERAYLDISSIFDDMKQGDMVLAFFPCTRFEAQILLGFRCEQPQQTNWNDTTKLGYDLYLKGAEMNKCKHYRKCPFVRAFGYCPSQIGEGCGLYGEEQE